VVPVVVAGMLKSRAFPLLLLCHGPVLEKFIGCRRMRHIFSTIFILRIIVAMAKKNPQAVDFVLDSGD
jgi:hypothetical protein